MRRAITTMLFCLSSSSALFAEDYLFTSIDYPDATYTEARGINARGDVVGLYNDADDVSHAFLLRNGEYSTIDIPADGALTIGSKGINARGDILGNFVDADDTSHGFLLSDGRYTQIDYPEASATLLFAINNAGDIVGQWRDALENGSGFIFRNGEFHDVHVPDSLFTSVFGVQDNGRVLVGHVIMDDGGSGHGFLRTRSGVFRLIDVPGTQSPCTTARWINQAGDIAGFFELVDRPEDCTEENAHGFILRDGHYESVDVPGATATRLFAINDDGVIAGAFTDRRGNGHGFKAVPGH